MRIPEYAEVHRDERNRIRHVHHGAEPYFGDEISKQVPRALAAAYLREVAEIYAIDSLQLGRLGERPSDKAVSAPTELRFAAEKTLMETTTVSFAQTHLGLPVWEAGFSVVVQGNPLRVVSSHSTLHEAIDAEEPPAGSRVAPDSLNESLLADSLGLSRTGRRGLKIRECRWRIYRYAGAERLHPEIHSAEKTRGSRSSPPPTLALPAVPDTLREGRHYVVTEALFALPLDGWGALNWRAFVEPETGAVLYLRAFVACVTGQVFVRDPASRSNDPAITATAAEATLNTWRQASTLPGLTAPAAAAQQALTGTFVVVSDTNAPTSTPPTRPVGSNFDYGAKTDNFAAVNAYYHVDNIFRLMQSMGFTISGPGAFFDGTTFPVPVDHRGFGDQVNARCAGNAQGDGIGRFEFGRCATGSTVGMCTEFQTVAHEFSHALLHDAVHSPNFGFCHSAGDALATILSDPYNTRTGNARFQVFPWCPIGGSSERFANRDVTAGWAFLGTHDDHGYGTEEILCAALFRAYQVTGGDSTHPDAAVRLATREQAARYAAYLIFRSIGSLATNPVTATPDVGVYTTALMNADTGTTSLDGYPGGTHHKLLRWTFERQGWYQPPGTVPPVSTAGAPPAVDVYIDDGRAGQYWPFLENFWETTDIWNLTSPNASTTPADHTTPLLGVTNYGYVRVRNRGTQTANNVVVHGFHDRPSTALLWPGDWQAMTTPRLPAVGAPALSIAANGVTTVGPFEWTPTTEGHECLLFWVSAEGDRANADAASGLPCATGPTPHWRIVPFDNNIAQRNVAPVPGGGRSRALCEALEGREFWVKNPGDTRARMRVEVVWPTLLQRLGWRATVPGTKAGWVTLKPGETLKLRVSITAGKDFTPADLADTRDLRIRVRSIVDRIVVGGLTWELDPAMKAPAREKPIRRRK